MCCSPNAPAGSARRTDPIERGDTPRIGARVVITARREVQRRIAGVEPDDQRIDGELRHATCTAIDEVEAAVLTRSAVAQLIEQHPAIGAKLLVKITQLLAQRLRNTSAQLVKAVALGKQRDLFRP